MGRSRGMYHDVLLLSLTPCLVLSFMSAFGGPPRSAASNNIQANEAPTPPHSQTGVEAARDSPPTKARAERAQSLRPASMIGGYQPPLMEIAQDTIPELLPIFTFLNSHSNKLYQEGYFLKLNDLDTRKSKTSSLKHSIDTLYRRKTVR